jgi:2-iminobutanoate/2-iminopropanoate deaminase
VRVTLDNPPSVSAPFATRFSHVARLDFGGGALLMLSGQAAVDDDGAVAVRATSQPGASGSSS